MSLGRAMLDFERPGRPRDGRYEQLVRQQFGVSLITYTAELNRLLDDPEALQYDPITVNRLRRLRDDRRRHLRAV